MHKTRLLKIAKLLEKDATDPKGICFSLRHWAAQTEKLKGKKFADDIAVLVFDDIKDIKLDCTITACAVGLVALSGIFKKEGFSYDIGYPRYHQIDEADLVTSGLLIPTYTDKDGNVWRHYEAVERFCDISYDEAKYLFGYTAYMIKNLPVFGAEGELAVAARIREFVKANA